MEKEMLILRALQPSNPDLLPKEGQSLSNYLQKLDAGPRYTDKNKHHYRTKVYMLMLTKEQMKAIQFGFCEVIDIEQSEPDVVIIRTSQLPSKMRFKANHKQ